jgi:hypothetical protein
MFRVEAGLLRIKLLTRKLFGSFFGSAVKSLGCSFPVRGRFEDARVDVGYC